MTCIAGYDVIAEFTTTGGGRCQWTFATRGDRTFFLKRFLQPKPVLPGQPGGAKALEARHQRCQVFEARQNKILTALKGKVGTGGNLIAPVAFFQAGGSYYKVTEKIDAKGVTTERIQHLAAEQQAIILRSAANSVRILHSCGIVHGDIKTDNLLIRAREGGLLTASLIDFDDCYFAGSPPLPPEDFVFDPSYASPEVFDFVADSSTPAATRLGFAADIFALGVVFVEYLTAAKPRGSAGAHHYIGEAIRDGAPPKLSLPPAWQSAAPLMNAMLSADPAARPAIAEVLEKLKKFPVRAETTTSARAPRLHISPQLNPGGAPSPSAAAPTSAPGGSLRGRLSRKDE